jgi:hypothetical protein
MITKTVKEFAETHSGRSAEGLLANHKVKSEQIFETVRRAVSIALTGLLDGAKYSTEMLCGDEVWALWHPAEVRVAGMVMAFFVRTHDVKLYRHVTPSGKGKALYCTQPSRSLRLERPTPINLPKHKLVALELARKTKGKRVPWSGSPVIDAWAMRQEASNQVVPGSDAR